MAIREIITISHPPKIKGILHRPCHKVSRIDDYTRALIQDLWDTLDAVGGAGLSAPQINVPLRVIVARHGKYKTALVNPEIKKHSTITDLQTEACLSIPGFIGENVERPKAIKLSARSERGGKVDLTATGWMARIIQHEIDHLDGILYIERMKDKDDFKQIIEDGMEASA